MISDLDGLLGSDILSMLLMKGDVVHRARANLKVLV